MVVEAGMVVEVTSNPSKGWYRLQNVNGIARASQLLPHEASGVLAIFHHAC